jgi:FKBP-type peptidyl-prolyl cis-trans isomerase
MKRTSLVAIAATSLLASQFALAEDAAKPAEANQSNISYGLGMMIGERLKGEFSDIDLDRFTKGLSATLAGSETELTAEQAAQVLNEHRQKLMAKRGEEALAKGKAFLEANAKRDGVKTTDTGLQYEVLIEGDGAQPTADNKVTVHYEGKLIDGTVFDSSIARGQPATFPLSGVIPGWTEGVQLMKVGSKYRFAIPSELAYGPRGAGQMIGPNEVLTFDVELLGVE